MGEHINDEYRPCYLSDDDSAFEVKTNADRIRVMSDRELAKFLCDMNHECYLCPAEDICSSDQCGNPYNADGMLSWLQKEAKDEC